MNTTIDARHPKPGDDIVFGDECPACGDTAFRVEPRGVWCRRCGTKVLTCCEGGPA
jgi:hypothetical protein